MAKVGLQEYNSTSGNYIEFINVQPYSMAYIYSSCIVLGLTFTFSGFSHIIKLFLMIFAVSIDIVCLWKSDILLLYDTLIVTKYENNSHVRK